MHTIIKSKTINNPYDRIIGAVKYEQEHGKDIYLTMMMSNDKIAFLINSHNEELTNWIPHFIDCLIVPLKRDIPDYEIEHNPENEIVISKKGN